jgi:hypothetical protein
MPNTMNTNAGSLLKIILTVVLAGALTCGATAAVKQRQFSSQDQRRNYFKIQVVDRQTGRGVPLVELRTTNNIRYFTDSNGIVAFYEPGLMDRDVFFFVESHGYEFPKDGFGFRGTRLKTSQGGNAVIKIDRLNIAERLYRVTGQGIYRDSVLTGAPVPLRNPVLNGQVTGQDSVDTCIYQGRLFWMWGDTGRPSYPLGHFAMAGATSELPERGGLDPAIGVNLEYYVDKDGFSRPLCPLKEPGMVWLDGLLTVKDKEGRERMVAKYARMKDLGEAYERGLVVFNDSTKSFEPIVRSGPELLPYSDFGHATNVNVNGQKYYYFAIPFPVAVRMRVKAEWDYVTDPNRYEALTAIQIDKSDSQPTERLDLSKEGKPYRWVTAAELIDNKTTTRSSVIEAMKREKQDVHLYDIESGKKISPHGGSVRFNAYRQRWIMIFVQQVGDSSFLGEVWYAEADTPVGPWAYTRKIVTHKKYSFYNPMHHSYFDKDGGRIIFFEGTYSYTFSGSAEAATPGYDYNQIMYRLNVDDPRLALPAAVYQVRDGQGENGYLMRDNIEKSNKWNSIESVVFYAIEPNRPNSNLIPIYTNSISTQNGKTTSLTVARPNSSIVPLFYALPSTDATDKNSCIVPLYEYHQPDDGQRLYSTESQLEKKGWVRTEAPLCRVWKVPLQTPLLDREAKPIVGY